MDSLLSLIGTGAVGSVWLAEDAAGRQVALKRIPIGGRGGRPVHERELVALRLLADRLDEQPGLIRILHVGINDDELYYTMELADLVGEPPEAKSLDRELRDRGRFESLEALNIVARLLDAAGGLHNSGVVHRDIKPANILSVGGEWKLGDIGLLDEERTEMTAVGTPDFIPPWGPIDRRADLYALGRVLYCMVTGNPARSFPTLPAELLTPERQRATKLLNTLITKACDPDPEKRFQTTDEFAVAVTKTRREIELGGRLLTRRRALALGGGLVVASGLGIAAWPSVRRAVRGPGEWIQLFDGETLDSWIVQNPDEDGTWFVEDGVIRCIRDDQYKHLDTKLQYQYGRFLATVTPDHDKCRIGLKYGHPIGSYFMFYEDKYVWIRKSLPPSGKESPGRWLSFPGPIFPKAGESIRMEVDWGPDRTRLLVNDELLQEVDGLPQPGSLGLHVWGKGNDVPTGDSGSFKDIKFLPHI